MLNKIIKYIIFFLYSWCIYQSYFIIIAAISAYNEFKAGYLSFEYILEGIALFFFFIPVLIALIPNINLVFTGFIPTFITPILILIFVYCNVLYLWIRKQNIITAWILALTGMFIGPGLALCVRPLGDKGDGKATIAIIGINIFYFSLLIINYLQKKYWPDNKFANRIRSILKWPCLRT